MDVLSVGGKDYVKASVIARDLGYTADYVGQLCRSRRVNAKLVGRTWYVDRNSIHLHKTNRYRSTQSKSVESLKESIEIVHEEEQHTSVPVHLGTRGPHKVKKPAYVAYSEDEVELIPEVKKAGVSIPLSLADAHGVKITASTDRYHFETPALEPIRFKGKLTLSNFEDEEKTAESGSNEVGHPKWIWGKGGKKAQNLAISPVAIHVEKGGWDKNKVIHHTPMTQATLSSRPTKVATISHIAVQEAVEEFVEEDTESFSVSRSLLFFTAASSAMLVVLLLGAESHITVADGSASTSYSFAIENLAASTYTAYENFESFFYMVEFSTNFFIF